MIKALIFDIGGVVIFSDFQLLYKNFANRAGISPEFVAQYHPNSWSELLLGNITLEGFFNDMQKAGARADLDLEQVWLEEALKIVKVNTELLETIDALRKRYTVGVLTNLTPTRKMVDESLKIYDHFEFAILSCVEHLKKPDPKFYELALKKANAQAHESVFVDDKERNTLAAQALGFQDILYTNNEKFFEDLRKLGVKI